MRETDYINIQGWMMNLGLSQTEVLVYATIHGFTRDQKHWFTGSVKYLSEWASCSTRSVIRALRSLEEKGLLITKSEDGKENSYQAKIPTTKKCKQNPCQNVMGSDTDPCQNVMGPLTICPQTPDNLSLYTNDINIKNIEISEAGASQPSLPVAQNDKPKKKPPTFTDGDKAFCKQVLDYLEAKSGYSYSLTKENLKYITARKKEGRTLEDLQHVIDFKCQEWLSDEKMSSYLRPNTLFRPTNFDNYLAQWKKSQTRDGGYYADDNYYYGS